MPESGDLSVALAAPAPVLMDGAMGTELVRLGHRLGAADWVASPVDLAGPVGELHHAYADAGARLHTANTFAASRHVLSALDQETRFEEINRAAVQLCRDAIGDGWIAGSISTYVIGSDRANLPRGDRLAREVAEQAALLVDAGCEMIALEMLFDVETSVEMIRAAAGAGVPLSAGLTCASAPDGTPSLRGEYAGRMGADHRLDVALPLIVAALPADSVLTIMHTQFPDTGPALAEARRHWTGGLGVYPNSGRFVPPDGWENDAACTPAEFVTHAIDWTDVAFIGGCCGIGPNHIAALARALEQEETHG